MTTQYAFHAYDRSCSVLRCFRARDSDVARLVGEHFHGHSKKWNVASFAVCTEQTIRVMSDRRHQISNGTFDAYAVMVEARGSARESIEADALGGGATFSETPGTFRCGAPDA